MSSRMSQLLPLGLAALLLAGCAGSPPAPAERAPEEPARPPEAVVPGVGVEERDWLPPLFSGVEDEVHYYISRLPDRRFVTTYGGEEHPRPWYIAAERLGKIGEPAIPALAARLESSDEYELMLTLYALMLASQDPTLMAATGGDYVELGSVLDPRHNAENRATALAWWQRHGWRWQSPRR
ncbi:hypothetical protein QC820_14505 [Halomonas mongoliensis]|uniref:Lipoprotein n=1 Tax=Halomonas mongoliensis TaxID=321265 RepID=A0ABU1GPS0_9GAMM|nr:hypothetical protein [Halomonas mongoliensis]MDR5894022.1 hypothetical protein [Halomonas mongoliensis]